MIVHWARCVLHFFVAMLLHCWLVEFFFWGLGYARDVVSISKASVCLSPVYVRRVDRGLGVLGLFRLTHRTLASDHKECVPENAWSLLVPACSSPVFGAQDM